MHWASLARDNVLPDVDGADRIPERAQFSVTFTFTTSTPASPIDVGAGRDLTVNRYLATTVNDAGRGFLHRVAGRCTNIRSTAREARTVDPTGYCNFKDTDCDLVYAEYRTNGASPASAIALTWTFKSGTGKYDGIAGTATDTNSNNLDDQDAYQATGRMTGAYKSGAPELPARRGRMTDQRGNEMPTSLPERARKGIDFFLVFVIALATCMVLIEIADPAPMDVAAEFFAAL